MLRIVGLSHISKHLSHAGATMRQLDTPATVGQTFGYDGRYAWSQSHEYQEYQVFVICILQISLVPLHLSYPSSPVFDQSIILLFVWKNCMISSTNYHDRVYFFSQVVNSDVLLNSHILILHMVSQEQLL